MLRLGQFLLVKPSCVDLLKNNHFCNNVIGKLFLTSEAVNVRQPIPIAHFSTKQSLKNVTERQRPSSGNDVTEYEEIYVGLMSKKLFLLKATTLTTSIAALFIAKDLHSRIEFPNQTVMVISVGFLLCFNFLTPVLINSVAKKYCIRMFYNHCNKEYIAEIYTLMFKKKRITFTPEDVSVPDVSRFFTVAYVKGYPLFFDVNHFKNIDYYRNIMKYDKPINLKLSAQNDATKVDR